MAAVGNLFCLLRGYYIKHEINPLEYCSCFVVSLFRWHPLGTVMHPPVIKNRVQNYVAYSLSKTCLNLSNVSSNNLDMMLQSKLVRVIYFMFYDL